MLLNDPEMGVPATFCEEKNAIGPFDLGRGVRENRSSPSNFAFSYIHPVTAIEAFNNLFHMNRHFPDSLRKLYPQEDDYAAIIKCAGLCAHFLGGFASIKVDPDHIASINPSLPRRYWEAEVQDINKQHNIILKAWEGGAKIVGTPGTGKTTRLSTVILGSVLNNIPTTIAIADHTTYGVLTTDFSNPNQIAAKIKLVNDANFPTSPPSYITSLESSLLELIPPSQKHCLVIDPLEQKLESRSDLPSFEVMYRHLGYYRPNTVTFAAHPTPHRIDIPNKGKGDPALFLSGLAFTNSELTQQSLRDLFKSIALDLDPKIQHLDEYLELAMAFTVPTFRSWRAFFNLDHEHLIRILVARFQSSKDDQVGVDYTEMTVRRVLGNQFAPLALGGATYSTWNNDKGTGDTTMSAFIKHIATMQSQKDLDLYSFQKPYLNVLNRITTWTDGPFF